MLSLEDCLAMSGLTEEEIDAIAQHEHVPEVVAAEIASYLVHDPNGMPVVRRIILDDLRTARAHGDAVGAHRLELALRHFLARHKRCRCATEEEVVALLAAPAHPSDGEGGGRSAAQREGRERK